MEEKVDFVIPWVDGNDKKWQEKRKKYEETVASENDNSESRFRDYGTLKYVFRSIEKFAPWVNKIYLVTDNQIPNWLNDKNPKVTVVDHTQIISKEYLPVFNSNIIDWNIDNIPGLSENFVYFNDDTLINNYVKKEDFFKDGLPRDSRLYTELIPTEEFNHIIVNNEILINKYVKNRWPISKRGLWNRKYELKRLRNLIFLPQIKKSGIMGYIEPHGPLSLKKSYFKKAKRLWGEEIDRVFTHRFRSLEDINIWLVRHLQLEDGSFIPARNTNNSYTELRDLNKVEEALVSRKNLTVCINDKDGVKDFKQSAEKLEKFLNKKFPQKSSFEKNK